MNLLHINRKSILIRMANDIYKLGKSTTDIPFCFIVPLKS